MAVKIQGGSNTAGQANVSTEYELMVKPTTTVANAGVVVGAGDSGQPTDAGGSNKRSLEVTGDWRLRVNQDRPMFSVTFGGTQHAGLYYPNVTWTSSHNNAPVGGLALNSGTSTSAGSSGVATIRSFTIPTEGLVYFSTRVRFSTANVANHVFQAGFKTLPTVASTVTTDGVFVQLAGGELRIVQEHNSTLTSQTGALDFTFVSSQTYAVVLGISKHHAELWIDNEYIGRLDLPAGVQGSGVSGYTSHNAFITTAVSTTTSPGVTTNVYDFAVWDGSGQSDGIPSAHLAAQALQATPNLMTAFTSSTNLTNSVAIPTFALSNTTPGSTAQMGGICSFAATASGNTHYVLWSLQNDVSTSLAVHGKTFLITGCRVEAVNAGAANSATVPTTLLFGVAGSNTAATLAITDSPSNGNMSPRIMPVGVLQIPINAVVGQQADRSINVQFETPIAVPTGSHAQIIMRILSGAATASQTITVVAALDGYWQA